MTLKTFEPYLDQTRIIPNQQRARYARENREFISVGRFYHKYMS